MPSKNKKGAQPKLRTEKRIAPLLRHNHPTQRMPNGRVRFYQSKTTSFVSEIYMIVSQNNHITQGDKMQV
jgi:hypothetical protein